MNTDYQDIKSYKKPNICENLCPNLAWHYIPFEIKIPNDETLAAMSEAEQLNGDLVTIDDFVK